MPDFGIDICHRIDGDLFNLRRLKSKSRTTTTRLSDFLYADDAALGTTTQESLQNATTALNSSCTSWGLTISKPKTEVMHVQCADPLPTKINDFELKKVHKFTYLGGDLIDHNDLGPEIKERISRAAFTFCSFSTRCFHCKGLSTNTKLTVYQHCCTEVKPGLPLPTI